MPTVIALSGQLEEEPFERARPCRHGAGGWAEWEPQTKEVRQSGRPPTQMGSPRCRDQSRGPSPGGVHRTVAEIRADEYRVSLVLQNEIQRWVGDLPWRRKKDARAPKALNQEMAWKSKGYQSQMHRPWWNDEVFAGLPWQRGVESGAPDAEAFASLSELLRT